MKYPERMKQGELHLFGKLNVSSEVFYKVPVAYFFFHHTHKHTRIFLTYSNAKEPRDAQTTASNVMLHPTKGL